MGIFSTRIQRLEKKADWTLGLLRKELKERAEHKEFLDSSLIKDGIFIDEKVGRVVINYPYLKTKYENDFEVPSEMAEDYYKLIATALSILLISNNDGEFESLQRKYRLGMLEIENIEKKFDILLK